MCYLIQGNPCKGWQFSAGNNYSFFPTDSYGMQLWCWDVRTIFMSWMRLTSVKERWPSRVFCQQFVVSSVIHCPASFEYDSAFSSIISCSSGHAQGIYMLPFSSHTNYWSFLCIVCNFTIMLAISTLFVFSFNVSFPNDRILVGFWVLI